MEHNCPTTVASWSYLTAGRKSWWSFETHDHRIRRGTFILIWHFCEMDFSQNSSWRIPSSAYASTLDPRGPPQTPQNLLPNSTSTPASKLTPNPTLTPTPPATLFLTAPLLLCPHGYLWVPDSNGRRCRCKPRCTLQYHSYCVSQRNTEDCTDTFAKQL